MKKIFALLFGSLLFSSAQAADIPYCKGTKVTGSKHVALQQLIQEWINQFHCKVGNNCILNFNKVDYHIAWVGWCSNPVSDPRGTTFICDKGKCTPAGTDRPVTYYSKKEFVE